MTLKTRDIELRTAFRKILGEQLQKIMTEKNISAEEVAEHLDTKPKNIYRILEGRYSISVDLLSDFLDALGKHLEFVDNE